MSICSAGGWLSVERKIALEVTCPYCMNGIIPCALCGMSCLFASSSSLSSIQRGGKRRDKSVLHAFGIIISSVRLVAFD